MKLLTLFLIIFIGFSGFSQEKEFHLQARIIDSKSNPVSDVYILNYRNLDKAVSRQNGVFDLWVLPEDSLMISHVSYVRKTVKVFDLMVNPEVKIEMDTVNILQVNVSPEQKTDLDRANDNLMFLKELEVPKFEKIKNDESPVSQTFKEHNRIFRSEASSLSILRFSPSGIIDNANKMIKRRKHSNMYSSKKRYKKKLSR